MLSVIMLNVIRLSVIMLNVIRLSVIMLNAIMLIVVAPFKVSALADSGKKLLLLQKRSSLLCQSVNDN